MSERAPKLLITVVDFGISLLWIFLLLGSWNCPNLWECYYWIAVLLLIPALAVNCYLIVADSATGLTFALAWLVLLLAGLISEIVFRLALPDEHPITYVFMYLAFFFVICRTRLTDKRPNVLDLAKNVGMSIIGSLLILAFFLACYCPSALFDFVGIQSEWGISTLKWFSMVFSVSWVARCLYCKSPFICRTIYDGAKIIILSLALLFSLIVYRPKEEIRIDFTAVPSASIYQKTFPAPPRNPDFASHSAQFSTRIQGASGMGNARFASARKFHDTEIKTSRNYPAPTSAPQTSAFQDSLNLLSVLVIEYAILDMFWQDLPRKLAKEESNDSVLVIEYAILDMFWQDSPTPTVEAPAKKAADDEKEAGAGDVTQTNKA